MKTLALLSEALPLALAHAGESPIETQEMFWRAFIEFDRSTDIALLTKKEVLGDHGSAMGMKLEEWRAIVEERISTPTGELEL